MWTINRFCFHNKFVDLMGAHPHVLHMLEEHKAATLCKAQRPIHSNHALLPDFSTEPEKEDKLPLAQHRALIIALQTRERLIDV